MTVLVPPHQGVRKPVLKSAHELYKAYTYFLQSALQLHSHICNSLDLWTVHFFCLRTL